MLKKILSVGGWTLISRAVGFLRDAMMAAFMGTGAVSDAFVVAMRLPNYFRAIFAEGAFNSAFIPKYSEVLERDKSQAQVFFEQIFSLTLIVQILVLAAALFFMPQIVTFLTNGFPDDPSRLELAITFSRITFPYLMLVTLVTVLSGILNAHGRFSAAAAAPIVMNIALVVLLSLSFLFPTAGHAASWGFVAAGIAELTLLWWAIRKQGLTPHWRWPSLTPDVKKFFKILGPAVIGSAGVQIAMFVDTYIASSLPTGAVSSIYYADRIFQLPVGVIGVAAGTVLLPEMSRKLSSGDKIGANKAQNRAAAFIVALTAPFFVAFLTIPDLILSALFQRGRFDQEAVALSSKIIVSYTIGLFAIVLIRTMLATFYSRQDTRTPVIASLLSVIINVFLKFLLVTPLGTSGLALATSFGAWLNLGILLIIAVQRKWISIELFFIKVCIITTLSCIPLALFALWGTLPVKKYFAHWFWANELSFLVIGFCGAILYLGSLLFGLKICEVSLRKR